MQNTTVKQSFEMLVKVMEFVRWKCDEEKGLVKNCLKTACLEIICAKTDLMNQMNKPLRGDRYEIFRYRLIRNISILGGDDCPYQPTFIH